MRARKITGMCLTASLAFTAICLAVTAYIFFSDCRDPRWRVFDFTSRQATELDIYSVSDVPAISSTRLVGPRKLRIEFTPPISASSWEIRNASDRSLLSKGPHPDIQFPDSASNVTYLLIPEGITLPRKIAIFIQFYPKENYAKAGLSWPDNYFAPSTSLRFNRKRAHSIDEWAGLPDTDPDMIEAKKILAGKVEADAPVRQKAEQVFRFVMREIRNSGGTPTDKVLDSSPMTTYRMLRDGTGKGFCENRALVYYLFANAAGVKTRLVDIAGKFGPLKLTGHYFCESWFPDQCSWFIVDPMSSVAYVTNPEGRLLSALDIKKLYDTGSYGGCGVLAYDAAGDSLAAGPADRFFGANKGYYNDIVMAYKFGYPRNASYSRIGNFLFRPTLLYSPFELPRLYLVKDASVWGFLCGTILSLLLSAAFLFIRRHDRGGTA